MPSRFTPTKKAQGHTKHAGRKRKVGRPAAVDSPQSIQRAGASWRKRTSQLLVTLSGRQGESFEYSAVIGLRVLLQLMDEATDLQWDSEKETMRNLESVYRRASTLTQMSVSVLKERFRHFMEHEEILVSDKATRGRGSPNCDRTALRKLTLRKK